VRITVKEGVGHSVRMCVYYSKRSVLGRGWKGGGCVWKGGGVSGRALTRLSTVRNPACRIVQMAKCHETDIAALYGLLRQVVFLNSARHQDHFLNSVPCGEIC
jgi:hypothetical protein